MAWTFGVVEILQDEQQRRRVCEARNIQLGGDGDDLRSMQRALAERIAAGIRRRIIGVEKTTRRRRESLHHIVSCDRFPK